MMRLLLLTLGLCLAQAAPLAYAQHEHHGSAETTARPIPRLWTDLPQLLPARSARGERAAAVLQPQGIAAGEVTVFAADGPEARQQVSYPVTADGARIEAASPKVGNYHWVIAREESPEEVRIASSAWYFGNPGEAPMRLLERSKSELEIVPSPLPREHGSYRESEKWRFLVRFKGQPLAEQRVRLETEFGTRTSFVTDAAGVATVLFPRDFRASGSTEKGDGHGPRRAQFVLATEKEDDGRRYLTAFNLTYGMDADRGRSLGWGAAFGAVGMLAATPLLRRRRVKPEESSHA